MKHASLYALLGAVLLLPAPVFADEAPSPPSPEQMMAIRDCAFKQGVQMPPPPGGHDDPASPPPHLTDDEKKIVDGCFEASGLTPPAHRSDAPENSSADWHGERAGPPPEQDFH